MIEQEKFQQLQAHFKHKDNQACLDKEHNQQRMDASRRMAYRGTFHEQPETSNHEHRPLFTNGNNGNNTPPRSPPRPTFGVPSSPPRPPPSQHEAEEDDEISSEDLM